MRVFFDFSQQKAIETTERIVVIVWLIVVFNNSLCYCAQHENNKARLLNNMTSLDILHENIRRAGREDASRSFWLPVMRVMAGIYAALLVGQLFA